MEFLKCQMENQAVFFRYVTWTAKSLRPQKKSTENTFFSLKSVFLIRFVKLQ